MRFLPLFGLTLLAGLCAGGAFAAEAISGANVRSGPGTGYGVVDQLTSGESVTVTECAANGWCRISHSGPDGWVSATLLADNGNAADYYNAPGGRVAVADDRDAFDDAPRLIGRADEVDDAPRLIGRADDLDIRFGFGSGFFGFGDGFMRVGPRGERGDLVCLVTFFSRADVAAGRDADVQRAELLPMRVAERRDGPNDRRAIFDYGSDRQTTRTCRYLDRLN